MPKLSSHDLLPIAPAEHEEIRMRHRAYTSTHADLPSADARLGYATVSP